MGGGRACHALLHSPSSQVHAVHTMKTKRKQKQDCPSQSWELRSPCGTALRPVGECARLPLMNPRITSHQGLLFILLALHSPSSHSLLWKDCPLQMSLPQAPTHLTRTCLPCVS